MATPGAATASTAPQHRPDYQFSTSVRGLLKDVYIPALNNTTFNATPLLSMFGRFGGDITFVGNKIIKAFKHQMAGGFGAIPEGGNFVTNIKMKGFQGEERLRYLNAYMSLTGPAAATVRSGPGAFVDAVPDAMDDTLKKARQQIERMVGSDGLGVIGVIRLGTANLVAATGKTATFQISTTPGSGGYSKCQFISEGMRVRIMSAVGTFVDDDNATGAYNPIIVSAVDYQAGTCTLTSSVAYTLSSATDYYLTLEDSYGNVEAEGTVTANTCLEPNGLTNLVDTTTYTSWGKTRSNFPHALNSYVKAAGGEELDEELLMTYMLDLVNLKQSTPNVLVVDPRSRLKFFSNRKEDRRLTTATIDTTFGFRSASVVIDNYTLLLQSLATLLPGSMFILNTNAFKFLQSPTTNGFNWIESGGQILRPKEGSDAMFATAVNYMQFVCEDPKGQAKITGLSYS